MTLSVSQRNEALAASFEALTWREMTETAAVCSIFAAAREHIVYSSLRVTA